MVKAGHHISHRHLKSSSLDHQLINNIKKQREFRCHFCNKTFLRNEHLQRHERLHTKEKPFECTDCPEKFTRRDLLSRHCKLRHGNTLAAAGRWEASASLHHHGSDIMNGNTQAAAQPQVTLSQPCMSSSASGDANIEPYSGTPTAANAFTAALSSTASNEVQADHNNLSWTDQSSYFGDFDLFIDGIDIPYMNSMLPFDIDQSCMAFPTTPLFSTQLPSESAQPDEDKSKSAVVLAEPEADVSGLFEEFSQSFPSFRRQETSGLRRDRWNITQAEHSHMQNAIHTFASAIVERSLLPSRHAISRYIASYFEGFHRHLPLLHFPTFSATQRPIELALAVAAIGAQYSFDNDNATQLFKLSRSIAYERLRQRRGPNSERSLHLEQTPINGSQISPAAWNSRIYVPLPLVQTFLLLMAMSTWGDSNILGDHSFSLQSSLADLIREENLLEPDIPDHQDLNWTDWALAEGVRRTVAIVYCFFNFRTIVLDTSPPILNSELNLRLPSSESAWEASSEADWRAKHRPSGPEPHFQSSFTQLFSPLHGTTSETYSSLGGYILILALIQHIYLLREVNRHNAHTEGTLPTADINTIELALRNWQSQWEKNPESSLQPGNPQGPISFNSTALLRMAYIRLNVDVGPWRALGTGDPQRIALFLRQAPHLRRNQKLTRTVLYSAHALSIPVKLGVNVVARNQTFKWSLQHSLCALECVYVISKWLEAVQSSLPECALDQDEMRLFSYIVDMAAEADSQPKRYGSGSLQPTPAELSFHVVQIWSKIFSGEAVWNVVHIIGKSLDEYAHALSEDG